MTTPRDDIAGLIERLRKTLAGVEPDDFGGDNLAIFIASELEPSIDDETLDDSGTWKQGAIDACDRVLDAIHAHYATAIDALQARVKELEGQLRTVQNAAKTIAACQGTELEHLRQNITFDHKLRDEHESLLTRDAMMTEALESAESRALRAEQERDEAYERAAKIAENPPKLEGRGIACIATGRSIAAAIRRLAVTEKEGTE